MAIEIAKKELAKLLKCDIADFLQPVNKVISKNKDSAIRMVSFGTSTICSVNKGFFAWAEEFYMSLPSFRCFDNVQLDTLNSELKSYGHRIASVGEYFIPDMKRIRRYTSKFKIKTYYNEQIKELHKLDDFKMALSYGNPEADKIAVVAYDGGKIIAIAACSSDFENMYQIGVDVLEDYRNKGIAKHIVSELTYEILNLGKLPFVGSSIGNIASKKLAYECGFVHAWIELYSDTIGNTNKYLKQKYHI